MQGIYDMLIRRKRLRWMDHQPSSLMEVCFAGDVMTRPPVTLRAVEKLATIVEVLRSTPHHGFPVVSLAPPDDAASLRSLQQPQQRESANTRRGGARREAGADGVAEVEEEGTLGDASVRQRVPAASGEGRLEGVILRSTLRVLLAARFHQVSEGGVCSFSVSNGQDRRGGQGEGERGRSLSLWERITAQHWQKVSIDGDNEMYELLACRRYTGERSSLALLVQKYLLTGT
jgi:CBS domain-containing protein